MPLGGSGASNPLPYIVPDTAFSIGLSIEAQIMPILRGLYTVAGPVVGAVVLTLAGEYLRTRFEAANLLVYGVVMVLAILCLPGGLVGLARRWWAPFRVRRAEQPQEGVADVR